MSCYQDGPPPKILERTGSQITIDRDICNHDESTVKAWLAEGVTLIVGPTRRYMKPAQQNLSKYRQVPCE